jgi:hypothetical protein
LKITTNEHVVHCDLHGSVDCRTHLVRGQQAAIDFSSAYRV